MRAYYRTGYGGISMGPIGWLLFGPFLFVAALFGGLLRWLVSR